MDLASFDKELTSLMGRALTEGVMPGKMLFAEMIGCLEMHQMNAFSIAAQIEQAKRAKQQPTIYVPGQG
jgi:hypothetical protein